MTDGADLFASDFTYSFLANIETSGPQCPRRVRIPPAALEAMANMERQFWEIKSAHFDVVIFFKKGKFYELYDCDAVIANREFGLKMVCDTTNRGKMRMAGVPEQSFHEWARLFVFRGYKIGRVEQMSPGSDDGDNEGGGSSSSKVKIVPRQLVQILTKGTVTDPSMISGHDACFVLSLVVVMEGGGSQSRLRVAAVAVDLGRSVVYRASCGGHHQPHADSDRNKEEEEQGVLSEATIAELAALLLHLRPKEVILPCSDDSEEAQRSLRHVLQFPAQPAANNNGSSSLHQVRNAQQQLQRWLVSSEWQNQMELEVLHPDDIQRNGLPSHQNSLGHVDPSIRLLAMYLKSLKMHDTVEPLLLQGPIETFEDHLLSRSPVVMSASSGSEQQESVLVRERRWDKGVVLDAAAISNLELVSNLKDHTEKHSLYACLCRCATNGGRRLFRTWLLRPPSLPQTVIERQRAVRAIQALGLISGWGPLDIVVSSQDDFAADASSRKRTRDSDAVGKKNDFQQVFQTLFQTDFDRSMSRLGELKRENPNVAFVDPLLQYQKHLQLILTTIHGFQELSKWAKEAHAFVEDSLEPMYLKAERQRLGLAEDAVVPKPRLLMELLEAMMRVAPTVDQLHSLFDVKRATKSGTVIPNRGTMPEYDDACDQLQELEALFGKELSRLKKDVLKDENISFCDIGKDLFLVEVPVSTVKRAGGGAVEGAGLVERSRTMKTIKYSSRKLEDAVEQYKKATLQKSNALVAVLRAIATRICEHCVVFFEASHALSYLDCLMALTTTVHLGPNTCMPEVVVAGDDDSSSSEGAFLEASGIYHPLLAMGSLAGGSQGAVPNDVTLNQKEGRVLVLTGPNMAGKSTLMRTVAVNLLQAQLGGYVCGTAVRFSPVRRIMTRIGARDAAHQGHSTLFVELRETSDILRFADAHTLCLVDELGRGTSTHDGFAIAHATLKYLTRAPETTPLTVFSTHYHSLAMEVQHRCTVATADQPSSSSQSGINAQLGYMNFSLVPRPPQAASDEAGGTSLSSSSSRSTINDIVFLFRLAPGICQRSYGVEVAVKAGVDRRIVEVAQRMSSKLSGTLAQRQGLLLLRDVVAYNNPKQVSASNSMEWMEIRQRAASLGAVFQA